MSFWSKLADEWRENAMLRAAVVGGLTLTAAGGGAYLYHRHKIKHALVVGYRSGYEDAKEETEEERIALDTQADYWRRRANAEEEKSQRAPLLPPRPRPRVDVGRYYPHSDRESFINAETEDE